MQNIDKPVKDQEKNPHQLGEWRDKIYKILSNGRKVSETI